MKEAVTVGDVRAGPRSFEAPLAGRMCGESGAMAAPRPGVCHCLTLWIIIGILRQLYLCMERDALSQWKRSCRVFKKKNIIHSIC